MRAREWPVSVLAVTMLILPALEAALRVDDWPASRVAMFSRRIADTTPVRRTKLVGTNARGDTVELRAFDLGLHPNAFNRQLPPDPKLLGPACGALGRLYNQRVRFPGLRLTALHAEVTVSTPVGVPPPQPARWTVPCPLEDHR